MSCLGTVLSFSLGAASVIVAAGVFAANTPEPGTTEPEPDYRPKIVYENRTITKKEVISNSPESCLRIPELAEGYKTALFELSAVVTQGSRLVSEAQQAMGSGQSSADYIGKVRDYSDQVNPLKIKAHEKRTALEAAVKLCEQDSKE